MTVVAKRPDTYADSFDMRCELCDEEIDKISSECPVLHCAACSTDYCSECRIDIGARQNQNVQRFVPSSRQDQIARHDTGPSRGTTATTDTTRCSSPRAFDGIPGPGSTPLQTPLPRERISAGSSVSLNNARRGDIRIDAVNAQMDKMNSGEYNPRRPIIQFTKPESPREASGHLRSRKANLQILRDIERRASLLL